MLRIGDEVIIINDDQYSISTKGSIGIITRVYHTSADVHFTHLTSSYRGDMREFVIHMADMEPYNTDPSITPVIRKIRQMEKHFASRHGSI